MKETMTEKKQAEDRRNTNIAFIYEACFKDLALRNKFFEEWKYVAETLANDDRILSDDLIAVVADWLEIVGGY